ncbi:MAG: NfeD family protein [Gammaproteobacteria bacterium]|nr:NfeD family protein [Gammaproteobacteria bacterium]
MWIFSDVAQGLMAVGVLLAVIDVLAFGFATLFLTLIGLAMLTTGILIQFGILSDQPTYILVAVAIFSAVYALLLWKPLKRLQDIKATNKVKSDLAGMSFVLEQDISIEYPGTYHFSGIDWRVESTSDISRGTEVEVVELQVGVMKVKPKAS